MWKKVLLWFGLAFWSIERVIGLAGLPDDFAKMAGWMTMLPDWLAYPALTASVIFLWQHYSSQWGWWSRLMGKDRETRTPEPPHVVVQCWDEPSNQIEQMVRNVNPYRSKMHPKLIRESSTGRLVKVKHPSGQHWSNRKEP